MPPFLPQAQLKAPGNFGNALARLGVAVGEAIEQRRTKNALAEFARTNDPDVLIGSGNNALLTLGTSLRNRAEDIARRKEERAQDLAFREAQARRQQANADRAFALQSEKAKADALFKLNALQSKQNRLENILTPGQKAIDKKFAEEVVNFNLRGGFVDVQKKIKSLSKVVSELEKGEKNLTGGFLGLVPETVLPLVNRDAADALDRVAGIAQESLTDILGNQFTRAEAEAFIRRAFNLGLDESVNAGRVRALVKQLGRAAEQKRQAIEFFEKHGTLAGFKGKLPNRGEFEAILEDLDRKKNPPPAPSPQAQTGRRPRLRYTVIGP
ncbi:MAG: hypothetical protein D6773_16315 [Alphaproteobacteria bacterium]|nr:MAG: hypothetical protein D6773_16315 [Alphaproteobacteria bacterium]